MERVSFVTTDGVTIIGDFYQPEKAAGKEAAILLHMMPATRESWREWTGALAQRGVAALTIDERGHGESTVMKGRNEPLDYQTFSDAEQQAKILDIEAAVSWLTDRGYTVTAILGASIGANLALQYQASHPNLRSIVLLSPGFNYRGIETRPRVRQLRKNQRVLMVGAAEDVRSGGKSAAEMAKTLAAESAAGETELVTTPGDAHGTDMTERDVALRNRIIGWLAV